MRHHSDRSAARIMSFSIGGKYIQCSPVVPGARWLCTDTGQPNFTILGEVDRVVLPDSVGGGVEFRASGEPFDSLEEAVGHLVTLQEGGNAPTLAHPVKKRLTLSDLRTGGNK